MEATRISEVMSRNVATVAPDTPMRLVIDVMHSDRHSCVVVVEDRIPVGVITERDLVGLLASLGDQPARLDLPANVLMSMPPVTICEEETLYEALVETHAERVRHLPVVDREGCLTGIITHQVLVNAHFHQIEVQHRLLERAIRAEHHSEELERVNRQLDALSLEDALLGIGNRRAMEVDLAHVHDAARRYGRPYSVVLFDVDYFKLYNDHYGHLAGDAALKQVAGHLCGHVRKSDRLYRYGGEEILLVLPETSLDGAWQLADRISSELAASAIPHCKSPLERLTVSGGVACAAPETGKDEDWRDILAAADRALYAAKQGGRNRVAAA